jgi:hypothetical protein
LWLSLPGKARLLPVKPSFAQTSPAQFSEPQVWRPLMLRRLHVAWRLYVGLDYSWRLAWSKAAYLSAGLGGLAAGERMANEPAAEFLCQVLPYVARATKKPGGRTR